MNYIGCFFTIESGSLPAETGIEILIAELGAAGFESFVYVLTEMSDQSNLQDDRDVFRLYQSWMKTGSPRAARMLEKAGINVISSSNQTQH